MILLEVGNLLGLFLIVYFVLHLPAFILLFLGLRRRKTKPESAKVMLIVAGVYFLIGGGICGGMF